MNSKRVKKARKAMKEMGVDWRKEKALYRAFKKHIKKG